MRRRTLGQGLEVSALGLGCMGLARADADRDTSVRAVERAIELGVTFLDTADVYSAGRSEQLLGPIVARHRGEVVLATKFGIRSMDPGVTSIEPHGRPEYVGRACDASLARLGIDVIDLYYLHRVDPQVPVDETIGAMAELVTAGKVRHLGISEASAEQLRRAHAVHPIAALQSEWSLWTRELEAEIVPTARDLGIGIVPYSPLGRGILIGAIRSLDDVPTDDLRREQPRLMPEAMEENRTLIETVETMAADHGVTAAQLALAWVLARGDDVVPIPGTYRPERVAENVGALDVELSGADLAALDDAFPVGVAAGTRYPENRMHWVPS